jgi:serine/threonine protein kinase/tetratricopeptide (TPR) repeat protein
VGAPNPASPADSSVGWATTVVADVDKFVEAKKREKERTEEFHIGEVLGGRYELAEHLGAGAFGRVYRAHDRVADETVAIKLLRYNRQRAPDAIAQLRSELRTARKVTHPGIVRIHDVIDLGDRLALSMELVSGETLKARLEREGRLAEPELHALAVDLTRALHAAHAVGVVHCDLKPANIILRATTGRAVITDFGISCFQPPSSEDPPSGSDAAGPEGAAASMAEAVERTLEDSGTRQELLVTTVATTVTSSGPRRDRPIFGTPFYMAPELFDGSGRIGPAIDVYALGVVLYEAATGTRPHQGGDLHEVVLRRLEEPPIPLATLRPDLSPELCRVIEGCLARQPADRITSDAMLRVLRPSRVVVVPSLSRRVWLSLLLALAVGGGGAWWWWANRLPSGERRVFVEASWSGEPHGVSLEGGSDQHSLGPQWLGRAATRLATAWLREHEHRFSVVDTRSEANVILRLDARPGGRGITLAAAAGRPGGREHAFGMMEAPSVREALEPLLQRAGEWIGQGRSEQGPGVVEAAVLSRLGTTSPEAYRLYTQAVDDFFRSVIVDVTAIERRLQESITRDPGWAHPYAALALVAGRVTPRAREVLERGRRVADMDRDPLGRSLLDALALDIAGQPTRARQVIAQALRGTPDDLLGLNMLGALDMALGHTDEQAGVFGRLHALRPDLQFGADLVSSLERAGRADEVPAIVRSWIELAPESEQALVTAITLDISAGRLAEAERDARTLLLLHGEMPHRLITLCDVLIVAGRTREARAVASRLVGGGERERALGLYRLGVIATIEGRFGAAHESLVAAVQAERPFGIESELLQTLEALVSMDSRKPTAGGDDRSVHLDELQRTFALFGMPAQAAAARYELALPRAPGGSCPAAEPFLRPLGEPRVRRAAEWEMLRAASEVGCARCAEVLHAGLGADERSTRSIFRFAACAEAEGALLLAADAFARAGTFIASSLISTNGFAPDLAVSAHLRLGRVLERLGRTSEARAEYERFLGWWGHADRLIPEVDEARKALDRLH